MTAGRLKARAGARSLWTPHVLSRSILKAWWSAEDHGTQNMTDDGSGLISNWVDRIGGLAVTAVTTARPTWSSNAFNGKPALTFDGAANCFVATALANLPTGAAPGEIWGVCQEGVLAANGAVFRYGGGGETTRAIVGQPNFQAQANDGATNNADTGPNLLSAPSIVSAAFAGTTLNGWINGLSFTGNPTTIPTLNTGTARLRIGANNSGSATNLFAGVIADILVIAGTLSTADRQRLEGYLAWKDVMQGSLPLLHPYRSFRP
jgi:hypothetical protein